VFLHAIFPSITKIPDIMGTKSALNSGQMLCFFIYWAINCAFLFVPVPRMKKLVYVKTGVFFIATIAYVIWMSQVGGIDSSTLSQPSVSSGAGKKWLIIKFFFLGLASCGTFISNASDLQRYTRRPTDVLLGQIVSFPLSNCLVGVLGNFIAVATKSAFGKVGIKPMSKTSSDKSLTFVSQFEWNPLTTLDNLMAGDRYNSRNRAGCAFISLAYVYSTIFSAIFENSIPAGNDIAALAPKYITVKRGFFICAVLSFAICPWYLLSTASVFITFLSSYQIFLSAITGILVCDYYLLRRGYLRVDDLYRTNPEGPYAFLKGFNLRAFAIYIVAVAPNFYGFLHQLGVHAGVKVEKAYCFAYPIGLILAFGGFFAINRIFPVDSSTRATGWQEPKEHVDTFDPSDVLGVLEGQPVEASIVTEEKHGEKQSPHVVTASRFD
jgi:NCS1 family nucleobase:cation symporter-1